MSTLWRAKQFFYHFILPINLKTIENDIMRLSLTDEEVVANMHGIGQFEGNMKNISWQETARCREFFSSGEIGSC